MALTLRDFSVDARIYVDSVGRKRTGRGRDGYRPSVIVLHIQEGYNDLSVYFRGVSADATIWMQRNGVPKRVLNDEDQTWTNGNYNRQDMSNPVIADLFNKGVYPGDVCLTIEHQGYYTEDFPAAQLQGTIKMVAYWCQKWGIPADKNHIVRHTAFDSVTRANCPGPKFPLDYVISEVKKLLGQAATEVPSPVSNITKTEYHEFKQTGQWVVNKIGDTTIGFWDYYVGHRKEGESEIAMDLGLPISGAYFDEKRGRIVQWFERARLEHHPENDEKYRVLEGLTGREAMDAAAGQSAGQSEIDQLKAQLAAVSAQLNTISADKDWLYKEKETIAAQKAEAEAKLAAANQATADCNAHGFQMAFALEASENTLTNKSLDDTTKVKRVTPMIVAVRQGKDVTKM